MKQLIATKWIPAWAAMVFIFYSLFNCVQSYILINEYLVPTYIDAMVRHFPKTPFNPCYLYDAKHFGYCIPNYYRIYIPIDFVFPFIYSFLFLSVAAFCGKKLFRIIKLFIILGAAFDYLENISFAIFLSASGDGLANFTAAVTLIKTIFFCINLFTAAVIIAVVFIQKIIHHFTTPTITPKLP